MRIATSGARRGIMRLAAVVVGVGMVATACASGDTTEPDAGDATGVETTSGETADDQAAGEDGGEAEVFKIAFSGPLSGPFSGLGQFEAMGAQIAVDELNSKFGDTPLEYLTYDDKATPDEAISVAQEAIFRDEVDTLIGPVFSGAATAVMQTFTDNKVPQLIVGSADTIIGEQYPYAFRVTYPSYQQAEVLISYVVDILEVEKVGIMFVNDALGESEKINATEELQARGLEPVGVQDMNTGATDVTGQLQTLKDAGAEALYLYASGADAATVIQGMNNIGLDVPVVGHFGITLESTRSLTEDLDTSQIYALNPCAFTIPEGEEPRPEVAEFAQEMRERYYDGGEVREGLALAGLFYDAVFIAKQAFENAGNSTDPDALIEGYKQISDFQGLMGTVNLSEGPEGWPTDNISIAAIDTYNPENGTFTRAPEAICGTAS